MHFINAEDADAHDLLICLNTGKDIDDPTRMRYTKQEFLKSPEEMERLFAEYPEAIATTQEIDEKIESYELNKKPIMPIFPIPEGFDGEMHYLRHVTYEGAKERWGDGFSGETKERVDFELGVIENMGFPSYFLIVWDFIRAARDMGVSVGPGRGSIVVGRTAELDGVRALDPGEVVRQLVIAVVGSAARLCRNTKGEVLHTDQSKILFNKLGLFDDFADTIVANDEYKNQFVVYDNAIDGLYEACKPEILGRRKDFPLAAIIHYLREVMDGKADRTDLITL